jgi:hypothetical protein
MMWCPNRGQKSAKPAQPHPSNLEPTLCPCWCPTGSAGCPFRVVVAVEEVVVVVVVVVAVAVDLVVIVVIVVVVAVVVVVLVVV